MKAQFVIEKDPTAVWPVTVRMPVAGKFEPFVFDATFAVKSEADYARILPQQGDAAPDADIDAGQEREIKARSLADVLAENARILPQLVRDWNGPQNPDGTPVPIGDLPALLTGPYGRALSVGLYRAVSEIRYGLDLTGGASEGNSAPSPANG